MLELRIACCTAWCHHTPCKAAKAHTASSPRWGEASLLRLLLPGCTCSSACRSRQSLLAITRHRPSLFAGNRGLPWCGCWCQARDWKHKALGGHDWGADQARGGLECEHWVVGVLELCRPRCHQGTGGAGSHIGDDFAAEGLGSAWLVSTCIGCGPAGGVLVM